MSNGKLKAYCIGVSAAHGSLAGVCHLNSQRDVKAVLPIYVKIVLSLLCYNQMKLRLFCFTVSSNFVIHPHIFPAVRRTDGRVCRQAIPCLHLPALVP